MTSKGPRRLVGFFFLFLLFPDLFAVDEDEKEKVKD
jgi:hypothetical protein